MAENPFTGIYTGIGAKDTPSYIRFLSLAVGRFLAQKGWRLRSGGTEGFERLLECGCDSVNGQKEIFLPWRRYNDHDSALFLDNIELCSSAVEIAKNLLGPKFSLLKEGQIKLLTRNVFEILGADLVTPTMFVIGITKNGENEGITGFSLRLAETENIPCFNLHNPQEAIKMMHKMGINHLIHSGEEPQNSLTNEVYVFASNAAGLHTSGSAKTALEKFGAVYGEGHGRTGRGYGVVLKAQDHSGQNKIVGQRAATAALNEFCSHAKQNPHEWFVIGCDSNEFGLNTEQTVQFATLFVDFPSNVVFPKGLYKQIKEAIKRIKT